jgi:mannose-P-dolichol utilization defect 1
MKRLVDIPLVMALAEWIWGGDDPDVTVSPTFCVERIPVMMTHACWSRLIVVGLGVAIILGACLNKAPVMINILHAKSTMGLSATAVYGETLVYANCAAYGILSGHPFTAFGENAALLVQSIIVTLLMWHYSKPPASNLERGLALLVAAVYIVVVTIVLPVEYHYVLMTSVMPVLLYSRGAQIYVTYSCRHTGAQSVATTSMNVLGGTVRILTTIRQVGWDLAVLGTIGTSTALNLTMLAQYFYYRENTKRYLADLKVAATKKD